MPPLAMGSMHTTSTYSLTSKSSSTTLVPIGTYAEKWPQVLKASQVGFFQPGSICLPLNPP
jgi:hypothetical protein